ncbi:MAG: prolyl oligopeptidase family serine peptidase [Porphyromonas sp.]|nr:prolyl oligopeptidase family serine peptidase [Porphyromonas sp.]
MNTIDAIKSLSRLLIVCGACATLGAQDIDWERVERSSASQLSMVMEGRTILPTWIGSSPYLYYYQRGLDDTVRYTLAHAASGKQEELLRDRADFVRQYRELSGDSSLTSRELMLYGLRFEHNDTKRFWWKRGGKTFLYDRTTGKLSLSSTFPSGPTEEPKGAKQRHHSQDSLYSILTCGYDLLLRNNRDGSIRAITRGGREGEYVQRYSPDTLEANARGRWYGYSYILHRTDDSSIAEVSLTDWLARPRPRAKVFRMPMPNESGAARSYILYYNALSTTDTLAQYLSIDKYTDQEVKLNPKECQGGLYFTRSSRATDSIDLCRIDLNDGSIRELIHEVNKPYLNSQLFSYRILNDGRILWWSERTGYGHYYLYSPEGKHCRQVSRGDQMVAGAVLHIDEARGRMIFAAYGGAQARNPYYRYYYEVGLDGRGQRLLTPEDATHELELSPDGKYYVDKYSRMDMPPVWRMGAIAHSRRSVELGRVDKSLLLSAGWTPPRLIELLASDGTTPLYGLMYLPQDLDSTKRYPLISNVYPGPQTDLIPREFSLDDNGNQSLAEMGFVVINIPSRGSSPLRGRAFYSFAHHNLRDYPLADDKHSIETLARRYSFIDLNRVGIYGHSGGAFQTVAAMCTYPELYKVGFAASGNHDNNIYIRWWGEIFDGRKPIPTNIELAPRLAGKLMLAYGDMDNNVVPGSTLRLADALIKAGKRFDMFVFPGKRHDLDSPYYYNLIRYYFAQHLLGVDIKGIDIIHHK